MKDYTEQIKDYIKLEIEVMNKLDTQAINQAMNLFEEIRKAGGTIYICGNGGSASTASHFVCDFNKGVSLDQKDKYNFICLNDNIPNMLAIANDIGYESVFEIPLQGKISSKDLFVGISGSGNSENVVRAQRYAKSVGCKTMAITGYDGGSLYKEADYRLHVPINNMQITEDLHMMFDHLMMWIFVYGK